MADHNEIVLESEICDYLAAKGWRYSKDDTGYDRARALFPEDIFGWLEDTQPAELAKIVKPGASDIEQNKAKDALLDRIVKQLDTSMESGGGTLNLLRNGFKQISARFDMCEFKPATTLNPATLERYAKVRVRVMRQVHYSTKNNNSIDLVLFVNGLPVATIELKTDFTQSVNDAIAQYRNDRPPKDEPLLGFGTRALVHFAASNEEIYMTTRLAGAQTFFLPFNMGDDGASGNPPNPHGSATSYLWERVLECDSWLNILGRLMHVQTSIDEDPITGKKTKRSTLLFPRFHQWEVVNKLLDTARSEGTGHRYLIQHSAGSGKTNSIAWTAHGLARLFDEHNERVFDSVIVVTDRTVLDDQLQVAISQIEPSKGMVVSVTEKEAMRQLDKDEESKSKSKLLAKVLSDGRDIVVVTIQTFPFAMEAIRKHQGLKGKRFAVIADEAHSSQTGATATNLRKVLTPAEQQDLDDGGDIDTEAALAAELDDLSTAKNISYFAFTATPKNKTLELFGRPGADGLPQAFHHYTMQQAIEEGFILDVLRNYTPYKTAWKIAVDDEKGGTKEVDQNAATKTLVRWVKLHPTNISQKVAIIVEHFRENVTDLLDGKAKAMVVCDSRKAAVRYKHTLDKYIKAKGYDLAALVAFSGDDVQGMEPEDGIGPFNERTLNPGLKGRDIANAFATDEYRVMLVANKFQTGFDQPLLCAMYVDKQLSGVTAVQTLSRLNRMYVGKDTTFVLDFVNDPAEILKAFLPYYRDATLTATTDPNLVHDLQNKLDAAGIYTNDEVVAVSDVVILGAGNNGLAAAIDKPVHRFRSRWNAAVAADDKVEKDELQLFRKDLDSFVRLYDFLSQIVDYGDTALERRSIFYRLLSRRIQTEPQISPVDISAVDLRALKQRRGATVDIALGEDEGEDSKLKPIGGLGTGATHDPKVGKLAEVIERLNQLFADETFEQEQRQSFLEAVLAGMLANHTLVSQARANSQAQFLGSPDLRDAVAEVIMSNQSALNKMADIFYGNDKIRVEFVEAIGSLFHVYATTGSLKEIS